jgi:predicted esterase
LALRFALLSVWMSISRLNSGPVITGLLILLIVLPGCSAGQTPTPAFTPLPTAIPPTPILTTSPTTAPASLPLTPLPTLALDDTSAGEYRITDFDLAHSPVDGDPNKYLILGNLPVATPAADLPPQLAAFLGRWEGYVHAPPVDKDRKLVLVIQQIDAREGRAVGYSGANLQYPDRVGDIHFRVIPGEPPSIEFKVLWPNDQVEIDTFTVDRGSGELLGTAELVKANAGAAFELSRERSFYVYKDYPRYLAGKGISAQDHRDPALAHFGQGYLLYLPQGYADQPEVSWPLILFLHGYGDRGDNPYLLAKASPFMYIREQGPLPAIIVAPLLSGFQGYSSFPEEYLDGVLDEVQAAYRVDPQRVYLTGLSMGGEAAYRLAVHRPETFAALAPLSAYVDSKTYAGLAQIKDLPVWAIHGAEDTAVPLERGRQPVEALQAAGGNVKFTVLAGHDHDTWTDTYSDPAFYEWLLDQRRP